MPVALPSNNPEKTCAHQNKIKPDQARFHPPCEIYKLKHISAFQLPSPHLKLEPFWQKQFGLI